MGWAGRVAGGSPRGSPGSPGCPACCTGVISQGSWSHPGPIPRGSGILFHPATNGTLKHPLKHTEDPWEFQWVQQEHTPSILVRCRLGTAAASLQGHHPL